MRCILRSTVRSNATVARYMNSLAFLAGIFEHQWQMASAIPPDYKVDTKSGFIRSKQLPRSTFLSIDMVG